MSILRNVAIAGASGTLGTPILNALLASKAFQITILSREGSSSTFPEGVTVKKVKYEDTDSLVSALKGQDALVSATTGATPSLQLGLIEAASRAGVQRFIPSEFGGDLTNDRLVEKLQLYKDIKHIVEVLKSYEAKGLTWTSVINGPFFDWGLRTGFLGVDIEKRFSKLYDSELDAAISTTTLTKIGKSVVRILQLPAETANRYVHISSFTLTFKQLHAALERVSGEKWSTTQVSTYDHEKEGREDLDQGREEGLFKIVEATLFRKELGADFALRKNDNKLLGLEDEDLDTVIRGVLA